MKTTLNDVTTVKSGALAPKYTENHLKNQVKQSRKNIRDKNRYNAYFKYLSYAYHLIGIIAVFVGLTPLYVVLNVLGELTSEEVAMSAMSMGFGAFIVILASGLFVLFQVFANYSIKTARNLPAKKNWKMCVIMSIAAALLFPLIGTIIGVISFVLLIDPVVRRQFEEAHC